MTLSYCSAATPLASGGPSGVGSPTLVNELLTYSPLLTYSSTANRRNRRPVAARLLRAAATDACAAASSWLRDVRTPWSTADAATACS